MSAPEIPDYQTIMLPILKYLSDKKEHTLRELIDYISDKYKLSEEQKREFLPSGKQPTIDNRVSWARTYMKKAGLLEDPQKGYVKITNRGLTILSKNPKRIDIKFLEQFSEFVQFRTPTPKIKDDSITSNDVCDTKSPDDLIAEGVKQNVALVKSQLLEEIRANKGRERDYYFEKIVLQLLEAMKYGKIEMTPRSGDGGIDGIVYEDELGMSKIYTQAKRYEKNTVPTEMVIKFIGMLAHKDVNKGVFVTTSEFTKNARDAASNTPGKNIILIDGKELVDYMIKYNIGIKSTTIEVKKMDKNYFSEDD